MLVDEENKIISRNARFVVANDVEGKVPTLAACIDLYALMPSPVVQCIVGLRLM